MANKVSARAGVSRNSHRPAALLHRPDIEGPSQGGRSAHGRAQSSLSLRKGKGEFLMVDAAAMRSLFIRLFFRVSTGCVNYRARGCTLSSLCSCMLLRKSRASDSHDMDENHTQIRTRANMLAPAWARGTSQPAARGHSCPVFCNFGFTDSSSQWHWGRRELVLRRGCLFIFLNPHLAQQLRSEDVERRCSCQTSVKLLSVSGAHTEGKSWTRSPCVGHRRRWETSTRLSPRKHHGCRR